MYNRIIGLIGPTGSGKSFMAAQMMAQAEKCAVYQLKRLHEEPAFVMVADDVIDGNPKEFALRLSEPAFHYVYLCQAPTTDGKKLVVLDLDYFIQACYTRERMAMIIDEAHFFCDSQRMPLFFRQAVVMGRSRYLDVVYCAQKFSTISKELTANTHEFYIWRITEPGDLETLRERVGDEAANAIANLRPSVDERRTNGEFQPGEYLRWKNTGEWEVIDPWKRDSSLPASQQQEELVPSSESESPGLSSDGENDGEAESASTA